MTVLLLTCQIALLVLVLRLMSRTNVSRLLSTSLLFYSLLWYIIPIMLSLVRGRSQLLETLVSDQVFAGFAVIETLSLIVALLSLFRPKPFFAFITERGISPIETSPKVILVVLLGGIAVSSIVGRRFTGLLGTAYLEQTAAPTTSLGEQWFGTYGSFGFIQGLIAAFAYACLTIKWPQSKWTSFLVILSALALSIKAALVGISGGSRIAMMIFPLLLTMRAREYNWSVKRLSWIVIGFLIVILPVGGSLTIATAELRQREYTIGDLVAYSQELLWDAGNPQNFSGVVIDQFVTKFDSISTGAFLVQASGAGFAGWRPYQGAFAAVIPRMILPDKAVSGSIDGTFRGHPSRLIPAWIGYGSDSASMGASPAAIAIWQFGLGGLLALLIANAINLRFVNSLLLSPSVFVKSLGVYLLGVPSLVSLFASPDVLILNAERILVMYVFVYLAMKLLSHNRRRTYRPRHINLHAKLEPEP